MALLSLHVRIMQRLPYCRVAELADAVGLKPTDFGHTSSSLVTTTKLGLLAQLVEQGTFNPKVWGSIPQQSTLILAV